jgi:hypothetical protein
VKILIVGIARSGTTSLLKGIESQGFYGISEPYNEWIRSELSYPLEELDKYDKIVVKNNLGQKPKNYKGTSVDFVKEFSKLFDKLIFLDRSNFDEHYESVINLWYKSHVQKQPVMSTWISEDIPNLFRAGFAMGGGRQRLQKEKHELKQLANDLKCDITYYEELYSNDIHIVNQIISDWKLPLNNNELRIYLDPIHKLKKDKKTLL